MSSKELRTKNEIREVISALFSVSDSSASIVLTRTLVFLAAGKEGFPPPGPERELVKAARRLAKYEREREDERKKEMA